MRNEPRSRLSVAERSKRLADLADRQHGVVSVRQLKRLLGYSPAAISRQVASGRLHPVHRGVYAVGRAALTVEGESLAAVLASGPGALLSNRSAAWLWEIARLRSGRVEVLAPARRAPRPPILLHCARDLRPADRALIANIPATALPRTLLDYAATVRFALLQKALERSEERGVFDLGAVEELLARTVGHPGHGRLRRALELYRPAPFTRSGLERRFLELVERAGLPKPVTGWVELGHELDVYWPGQRFVVELDVFETHGSRAAFERDRLRAEDLLLDGIRMTRVTGPRLDSEPRRVIERVRRLLAQGET